VQGKNFFQKGLPLAKQLYIKVFGKKGAGKKTFFLKGVFPRKAVYIKVFMQTC
jgi:hypothetical protein